MADITTCMLPTRPDGSPLKGQALGSYLKFAARLQELGATLLEPHWLGAIKRHRIRCVADHEVALRPNDLLSGRNACRVCSGHDPATAQSRFRALVAEQGHEVVGPYLNTSTPIAMICASGHSCSPRPNSVLKGQGVCRVCSGFDSADAQARLYDAIEKLGGQVIGEYVGSATPIALRCASGHDCSPRPADVLSGHGICTSCAGMVWDVFYVVTDPEAGAVKFGITSGDPRPRLSFHKSSGYGTVVRLHEGLPGTTARDLERELLSLMRVSGVEPIRGREYFPVAVLPTILHVVDGRLGDTGKQTITSKEN